MVSAITRCASISAFASLISIPIGITSFSVGLKICVITARIKKYESIIKKKRKNHDKIVLLTKKPEIQDIFLKTNYIRPALHMI